MVLRCLQVFYLDRADLKFHHMHPCPIHPNWVDSSRHFTIRLDSHVTSQLDFALSRISQIDFRHDESTTGEQFVSIRLNRLESTTFSTHPQSPDQLYFLSLVQIDFRHVESTEGETIRVNSMEWGSWIDFPVCQIANTKDESTLVRCIGQPSSLVITTCSLTGLEMPHVLVYRCLM